MQSKGFCEMLVGERIVKKTIKEFSRGRHSPCPCRKSSRTGQGVDNALFEPQWAVGYALGLAIEDRLEDRLEDGPEDRI